VKHRRAAVSYAKALFAVAKERDQAEIVSRELRGWQRHHLYGCRIRERYPQRRRRVAADIWVR